LGELLGHFLGSVPFAFDNTDSYSME
jgi:hypothetical protein